MKQDDADYEKHRQPNKDPQHLPAINDNTGQRDFDISIKRDIKCWAEICPGGVVKKQWELA